LSRIASGVKELNRCFFVKDIDDKNLLKDIGVFYCVLLYMKVGKWLTVVTSLH